MTQCSVLDSQCLSGVFESANRTCRLFSEPLVELEEGNLEEMVYFMKISLITSKYAILTYMYINFTIEISHG